MIPAAGWPDVQTSEALTYFPLPEPLTAIYRDGIGVAPPGSSDATVIIRSAGEVTYRAKGSGNVLELEVNLLGAYGLMMVDRVEFIAGWGEAFIPPAVEYPGCPPTPLTDYEEEAAPSSDWTPC